MLVIGYGNPGRLDDGLGPALAQRLEALGLPGVAVEADYQLTVEDAYDVAQHDVVVFADATTEGEAAFTFRRLQPAAGVTFSSHSVSPGSVLRLAADSFGATTEGYVLAVRGYEFNEFGERLSAPAEANLEAALAFITEALREGRFPEQTAADGAGGANPQTEE